MSSQSISLSVSKIELNDGNQIPIIGLGTAGPDAKGAVHVPREVYQAVKTAIETGYRHFDTAFQYQNEKEIGEAIRDAISFGKVKREDVFIVTKVANACHSFEKSLECIKSSLKNLRLDYVDLILIHYPIGYKEGGDLYPLDSNGKVIFSDVDYLETWKGLEAAVNEGLVKSIGVSNFNSEQLQRIIDNSKIKPAVNQFECHPYLTQNPLIDFCLKRDVKVIAYSPLGSGLANLTEDPTIKQIATKYNKTSAQILIRYQIERNLVVIPKTVTKSRIIENFNVFDFKLSSQDIETIGKLNRNERFIVHKEAKDSKYYPFNIPF